MPFDVIPAMDLQGGKVVRLTQGNFDKPEIYDADPLELARVFKSAGARRLHVVDLDGARSGIAQHFDVVAKIIRETGLAIQLGGGIRDMDCIDRVMNAGIDRVILGTVAVLNPQFVAAAAHKYAGAIAIGIDVRHGRVATDGWEQHAKLNPFEFAHNMEIAGAGAIIATSISHDGMLRGIDKPLMQAFAMSMSEIPVIASGGIGRIEHIADMAACAEDGIAGVILGKAYYRGLVSLPDALKYNA